MKNPQALRECHTYGASQCVIPVRKYRQSTSENCDAVHIEFAVSMIRY